MVRKLVKIPIPKKKIAFFSQLADPYKDQIQGDCSNGNRFGSVLGLGGNLELTVPRKTSQLLSNDFSAH
jgi:hypothetical protein